MHIRSFITLMVFAVALAVCWSDFPARAADEIVIGDGGDVAVEINKGRLIKLDRPIASVAIADPEIADVQVVSARLLFVRGKKIGETTIYAVDPHDELVFSAILQITHNLSKLEQTIKRVSPDSDVEFRSVDGGMVMEGFSPTAAESENIRNIATSFLGVNEKMVDMVKTAGSDQVMLQVKMVEMNRNNVKEFGINMQNMFSPSNTFSLQVLQGHDIEIDTNNALNGTLTEVDRLGLLDRSGSTTSGVLARWRGVTSLIEALETQGLVNTLAEPTLVTTTGKTASFLAGGEFPIPVNAGNNSISVEYRSFGVSLNFTPVVLSKDRISISVAPEVSTISFDNPVEVNGIRNPIILTRRASATIELGSGQTFALAGLLKSDGTNSISKFPGLGDVPVLGTLFRSHNFQNNQSELVILVTPYIVRPVSEKTLQTPLTGYKPPSDFQRLLMGNLYQQEPLKEEQQEEMKAMPELHGSGGFLLEE